MKYSELIGYLDTTDKSENEEADGAEIVNDLMGKYGLRFG